MKGGPPIENPMRFLAIAILVGPMGGHVAISCDASPSFSEPLQSASSRATPTVADLIPPLDALFQVTPALAIHSTTTIEIRRGASMVTLHDEKEVRRIPSGDFELSIRRVHQGSEAGDTEESFRAIRIGRNYFTRGSGGPFVQWDDALDEPARTLDAVGSESRALLEFLAPCLRSHTETHGVSLSHKQSDCGVVSGPTAAPMAATITEAQGHIRRDGNRLAEVVLLVRLNVTAGGHQASVVLRHRTRFEPLLSSARITPPREPVSSRRERPVRMVETVLSGLVSDWGPGAPLFLKKDNAALGISAQPSVEDHPQESR